MVERITFERRHSSFAIRIDGLLHLSFNFARLLGTHSWLNERNGSFHIELILDGGSIECDYDNRDLFKQVLDLLDQNTGNHISARKAEAA